VALAALFPAHGDAEVVSDAAKMAIALLFFLYGARLSPQQAWHGVRQWRLHLLVLATTFAIFPVLGLAARALVPSMLTIDLYNGLLFLCLVPSTVQSSIAFTSIARGHVSAAIVSASLPKILGIVLTPLLVVLLMNTSGAPRVDGTAIGDIVLQLLLPFGAGQLARRWIAGAIARHGRTAQGGRPRLHPAGGLHGVFHGHGGGDLGQRRCVAIDLVNHRRRGTACGGACHHHPHRPVGPTRPRRRDRPMLPLMIFHQIQLVVCAVIASRLAREADDSSAHSVAGPAVPAPEAGEEP
jgi:solute carrier family 10 (sodium/bile acid cotransporter), member 7